MFLLLVGLACLFPLSLYCLFLALLHQRRHPTQLSGPWDFAAVLAALSGFLLFGGTTLLFAIHSAARDAWVASGTVAELRHGYSRVGNLMFVAWGVYGLLLLGGSALMLWMRGDSTVFYNLAPDELEGLLAELCAAWQLSMRRSGSRYYVGFSTPEKADLELRRKAVLEIDGSPAMRQATLRWVSADPEVRRELEADLSRAAAVFEVPEASTAGWFLTASGALMMLMIFLLATFLLLLRR